MLSLLQKLEFCSQWNPDIVTIEKQSVISFVANIQHSPAYAMAVHVLGCACLLFVCLFVGGGGEGLGGLSGCFLSQYLQV